MTPTTLNLVLTLLRSPLPADVREAERLCGVRVRCFPYNPPLKYCSCIARTPRVVRVTIPAPPARSGRGAPRGTLHSTTIERLRAVRLGAPISALRWTPRQLRVAVRAGWIEVAA